MLKQLRRDQVILKPKLPLRTMISHNTETTCLDQLYDFTMSGFSGGPGLEEIFLASSLSLVALQLLTAQLCGS